MNKEEEKRVWVQFAGAFAAHLHINDYYGADSLLNIKEVRRIREVADVLLEEYKKRFDDE